MADFEVEELNRKLSYCDCCGHETHTIWGLVNDGSATVAAYWVSWTDGHLSDLGAYFDLVIGAWGEGTSADDRSAISMAWRCEPGAGVMVVDAQPRKDLATFELKRTEVIGTPLADHAFALFDAIWLQESRLFKDPTLT